MADASVDFPERPLGLPWTSLDHRQANRIQYVFGVDPVAENNDASRRAADPTRRT